LMVAILSLAALFVGLSEGAGVQSSPAEIAALWFFPFALVFLVVCIIFIDLEHWIIPHVLTITGICLGILRSVLMGSLVGVTWLDSLIGMAAGALPIILIIEGYYRLTGREGMGYGDVMMMAMAGAWFGYMSLPFIFLASSLQGIIGSLPMLTGRKHATPPWETPSPAIAPATADSPDAEPAVEKEIAARHMAIPFGPFIGLSILEWLFFQDFIRNLMFKF